MKALASTTTQQVVGNIRKVRMYRNYSQDYLAMMLGISQNAYSKIELGYTNVCLSKVLQIADILEVEFPDFIELDLSRLGRASMHRLSTGTVG